MSHQESAVAPAQENGVAAGELFAEFVAPKEPQREKYYVLVAFYRGPGPKHNQWRVFCDDRWTSYESVKKPAEELLEHHSPVNVFVLDPEVKWSPVRKDSGVVIVNRLDGPVAQECPLVDEKQLSVDVLKVIGESDTLRKEFEDLRTKYGEALQASVSYVETIANLQAEIAAAGEAQDDLKKRLNVEVRARAIAVDETSKLVVRLRAVETELAVARQSQWHKDAQENCELRAKVQELERQLQREVVSAAVGELGINLPTPVPAETMDAAMEFEKLRIRLRKSEEERGELAIKLAELQKSAGPKGEELCNEIDHAMRERNEARADLAAAKLEIRDLTARIQELEKRGGAP